MTKSYDEDFNQQLYPQIMACSELDAKIQIYMRFPEYEILELDVIENSYSHHRKSLFDWICWMIPKF